MPRGLIENRYRDIGKTARPHACIVVGDGIRIDRDVIPTGTAANILIVTHGLIGVVTAALRREAVVVGLQSKTGLGRVTGDLIVAGGIGGIRYRDVHAHTLQGVARGIVDQGTADVAAILVLHRNDKRADIARRVPGKERAGVQAVTVPADILQ